MDRFHTCAVDWHLRWLQQVADVPRADAYILPYDKIYIIHALLAAA